jgi:hypothetical protein
MFGPSKVIHLTMADANEGVQVLTERVIEPDVELVVVRLVGNERGKVIRAGDVRRGQLAEHLARECGHQDGAGASGPREPGGGILSLQLRRALPWRGRGY